MQVIYEPEVESLLLELQGAHNDGLIPFYQIGRCLGDAEINYIDVYIGLFERDMHKESQLKEYIRHKYGGVVRAISIEQYAY